MDKDVFRTVWKTALKDNNGESHLGIPELYSILIGDNISDRDTVLTHLYRCPECLKELNKMFEAQKATEALDIALPQLAGTRNLGRFMRIETEGGKYTLTIRQSLKDPGKGIITVEVARNLREKSEGSTIILKDCKGRKLLEGTIVNGQVSQKIEDFHDIDIKRFMIERR